MLSPGPDPALHLAAIVASSDDAIVSTDLDGTITSWNRGAERVFGYPAADAIGQPITLIIPSERLDEEIDVIAHVRRGELIAPFETLRRRKDGTLIEISITVSPIRDGAGHVVGALKIARDISARRAGERDLQRLRRQLMSLATASASILGSPTVEDVMPATIALARELFGADGYAMWRSTPAGWRVVHSFGISETFAHRLFPTGAGQPVARATPFTEPLLVPDVAAMPLLAEMREAYAAEGITAMIVFPLQVRGERSGTLVFYFRTSQAFDELDVQVGAALANLAAAALSAAEAYEEQRTAREAADYARQKATFLAEAGSLLAASLNYENTLTAVAKLAVPTIADWCAVDIRGAGGQIQRLAVTHVDPAKMEYARLLEERYPADPAAPGGVHEVLRTGQPVLISRIPAGLLDAAARDDEHRRILRELGLTSYMCVPLQARGRTFGALTFVSAESGREYADEDLHFAREIAARASLAVENARSYQEASEANRLKDEFLATLSHEMRTPLNAVLGYTRMLRNGSLAPEKTGAALDVVERNATALKQIIEDVLDVSRIISGRLRLQVEPVDLPAILAEACATVMPAANAKGVRVESVLESLASPISGDADRLRQIVWNLLSNAIKFTPRGGKVQLQLCRVNSHVEVTVSDTGQGIAPEFLPFAFERFRQANASFTREHGGLGLGLAIAKQLAELHGGTITAVSQGLGQGSTFTLTLPVAIVHRKTPASTERAHPQVDRESEPADAARRLDGVRVLAVDDDVDSLVMLRSVLEAAGATVNAVNSGAAALIALAEGASADVVIADIGMPVMDGLELIRVIRGSQQPYRGIPAAALTAYARSQDRVASLASGFDLHIAKPADPIELVAAVASLAARRARI